MLMKNFLILNMYTDLTCFTQYTKITATISQPKQTLFVFASI
jgi:hypothetical protein